jgi:hypothetical protein
MWIFLWAIERAMIEIENYKVTAIDVNERLVKEYIIRLALCRAHAGHDGRQDCQGDGEHCRGDN